VHEQININAVLTRYIPFAELIPMLVQGFLFLNLIFSSDSGTSKAKNKFGYVTFYVNVTYFRYYLSLK
tara:strand:- start:912 stop:1115 length:204 start_codon:yes stop_codon:yes gene_type:complete